MLSTKVWEKGLGQLLLHRSISSSAVLPDLPSSILLTGKFRDHASFSRFCNMVLEQLRDVASRQLQAYDEGTRQLVYILCLPLVDGVFASLLVSGAITTFSELMATSLTVFSGAGALAVLYSNSENASEAKSMVVKTAPFLIGGAFVVGLVAPIYAEMFNLSLLKYATGLTLMAIAAQIVDLPYSDLVPPQAVILTGMVLSLKKPSAFRFGFSYLPEAIVTVSVSLLVLYAASCLSRLDLNMKYIRMGGASALTVLGLSIFVQVPSNSSLVLMAFSFLASLR